MRTRAKGGFVLFTWLSDVSVRRMYLGTSHLLLREAGPGVAVGKVGTRSFCAMDKERGRLARLNVRLPMVRLTA